MSSVEPELPSGTVTFLFTDIEGSTTLLQTLGDGYPDVVREHRRILSEVAEGLGGVVYGAFADEISAVFRTTAEAVSTASVGQRSIAAATWPGEVNVGVRMGIHTGQPTSGRGEYLGLDVHRTARICSVGHGGQVLVSKEAHQALGENRLPLGLAFRDLGEHELKGIPAPERLFQLLIAGARNDFPDLRLGAEAAPPPQLPGHGRELAGSLRGAVRTLRSRGYARTLESDKIASSERFELPSARLAEEVFGDPLRSSGRRREK